MFTRRNYRILTAAAAVLLLTMSFENWVNVRSVMAGDQSQLAGSYQATVFAPAPPAPPNTPLIRALLTFNADGTLTGASDVVNLIQTFPGFATVAVGPAHGVWVRTGNDTFASTFYSQLLNAAPACLLRVRESITLTPTGNGYTGSTTSDILDCNGTPLLPPLSATLAASRMTVVPQP